MPALIGQVLTAEEQRTLRQMRAAIGVAQRTTERAASIAPKSPREELASNCGNFCLSRAYSNSDVWDAGKQKG